MKNDLKIFNQLVMKHFRIISIIGLLIVCCGMLGCKKDKTTTTIYGTVFNSITHEPIIGAEVEVGYREGLISNYYNNAHDHKFSSSVSGADGQFELQFDEVDVVDNEVLWYYLYVTAKDYYGNYQTTSITMGGTFRMDVNLNPE